MIAFVIGQFPISVKVGNETLCVNVLPKAEEICFDSGYESYK